MNEESRQILEMLAAGKITAADAERLLDKVQSSASGTTAVPDEGDKGRKPKVRFLCVRVDGGDEGEKVNVRVPLALIRTGIKLAAILPKGVSDELTAKGIDLSQLSELDADELTEALSELEVQVDSERGEAVRVCCE